MDRHEDEEIDFLTIQEAAELLRIPVAPGDVGLLLVLRADRGEAARSAAPVVLRAVPTSRLGAGPRRRVRTLRGAVRGAGGQRRTRGRGRDPAPGPGWAPALHTLAHQVDTGRVYDRDLPALTDAYLAFGDALRRRSHPAAPHR